MADTDSEIILNIHLAVTILFASSLVLGDYGNRFLVYVLEVSVHHRIVAGFIEPVLTKLVPAVLVLGLLEWQDVPDTYIRNYPYYLAFVGGVSIAVFERVLFIIMRNADITPVFVFAAILHVVNAVLIAGVIFSTPEQEQDWLFFGKLLTETLLAIIIHVAWNGWVAIWFVESFQ